MIVPVGAGAWMAGVGFRDVRELAVGELGRRRWRDRARACRPSIPATGHRSGRRARRSGSSSAARARSTSPATRTCSTAWATCWIGEPIDIALLPVWGWGPTLGRGLHLDPLRAAQALRLIRPRAAVPIHWGTYWPHALGRVFPERLVEPPAGFVEYAAELAPDVQTVPTAVGDMVEWNR